MEDLIVINILMSSFQGVGRKVMEKQGWKEGQGIGRNASEMTDALDNEG